MTIVVMKFKIHSIRKVGISLKNNKNNKEVKQTMNMWGTCICKLAKLDTNEFFNTFNIHNNTIQDHKPGICREYMLLSTSTTANDASVIVNWAPIFCNKIITGISLDWHTSMPERPTVNAFPCRLLPTIKSGFVMISEIYKSRMRENCFFIFS